MTVVQCAHRGTAFCGAAAGIFLAVLAIYLFRRLIITSLGVPFLLPSPGPLLLQIGIGLLLAMFSVILAALLVYDADAKWLFFNEATLGFLNLDRAVLQGLPDAWSILEYQMNRGDFGPMDATRRAGFVETRRAMFEHGSGGWILLERRDQMLHFRLTVLDNGWRLGMFRDVTDLEGARQLAARGHPSVLSGRRAGRPRFDSHTR